MNGEYTVWKRLHSLTGVTTACLLFFFFADTHTSTLPEIGSMHNKCAE